jgi:ADP-ribose pyrophosphatase
VLESRDLHVADPWFRLSVQRIQLPDGRVVDEYYRIAMPAYAVIVATTADGRFVMERGYKHGPQREVLCLPAGLLHEGERPLDGARRELLEETGYATDEWSFLGAYDAHGNYGCGRAEVFRAVNARVVAPADSGDLEDYRVELLTLEEIAAAIGRGDVALLSTIAALSLATHPLLGRR